MREKMGEAIFSALPDDVQCALIDYRFSRKRLADAALDALMEPTEGMVDAACSADLDIYWGYRAEGPGAPDDAFKVMIRAAKEGR